MILPLPFDYYFYDPKYVIFHLNIEIHLYKEVMGIIILSLIFIWLNKLIYTHSSKPQLDIFPASLVYTDVYTSISLDPYHMCTYACVYCVLIWI